MNTCICIFLVQIHNYTADEGKRSELILACTGVLYFRLTLLATLPLTEGANSAVPNPLAWVEVPFTVGGKDSKEKEREGWMNEENQAKDGRDRRKHPPPPINFWLRPWSRSSEIWMVFTAYRSVYNNSVNVNYTIRLLSATEPQHF